MRFFAVALSVVFLGSSALPASAQRGYYDRGAYRQVQCDAPYVSVNNRCVYGGNARGYYGEDGRGYRGGYRRKGYMSQDGAHCFAPYVSVGDRCVRAY